MNELLDTERVYVEELLCVLEVSLMVVRGGCQLYLAPGGKQLMYASVDRGQGDTGAGTDLLQQRGERG